MTPKRKRFAAGELRLRVSESDLDRVAWLIDNHPDQTLTISALIRTLILREYERLQPKTAH